MARMAHPLSDQRLSFYACIKNPRVWAVLGVVTVMFCTIAQAYIISKQPVDAAHLFFKQISSGQADAAYASASQTMQDTITRAAFDTLLQKYPILTSVSSQSYSSVQVKDNGTANLSGTLTGRNGNTVMIEVREQKENGHWRITSFLPIDASALTQ